MYISDRTLLNRSALSAVYRKPESAQSEKKPFQKEKSDEVVKVSNSLRRKLLDTVTDPRPALSRELNGVQELLSYTKSAVGELAGLLSSMADEVTSYYKQGVTDAEQLAAKEQFQILKTEAQTLIDTASYADRFVLQDSGGQPLFSQVVGPERYAGTFEVEFDADTIVDLSGLDIEAGESVASAAVDDQVSRVERFTGTLRGFIQGAGSQAQMILNSTQFYNGNVDILTEKEAAFTVSLSKRWVNQDSAKFFGSSNVPPRNRVLDLFSFSTGEDKSASKDEDKT